MFHRGHCNLKSIEGVGGRAPSVSCLGLRTVFMAASHGTTNEVMNFFHCRVAVNFPTEFVHPNLSNPGLWLFLEMYDEPQELYSWTCAAYVAC